MMVSACSNGFESVVIGKYGGEVKLPYTVHVWALLRSEIFSKIAARFMYIHIVIDDWQPEKIIYHYV